MGIQSLHYFLKRKIEETQCMKLRSIVQRLAKIMETNPSWQEYLLTLAGAEEKSILHEGLERVREAFISFSLPELTRTAAEIENEMRRIEAYTLYHAVPLSQLEGKKMAIDAYNWMFQMMSVVQKRVVHSSVDGSLEIDRHKIRQGFLQKFLEVVQLYLKYRILPIFVFDGSHPEAKKAVQEKRGEQKAQLKDRLHTVKQKLEAQDILERDETTLTEYRQLLARNSYITKEEIDLVRQVLNALGLPYLQAKGEGEKLCSMLAREGLVSFAFSMDTDTLAYGCPCVSIGSAGWDETNQHQFQMIYHEEVCEMLQLSPEAFLDLCIMCGCDYNTNIPRVGPMKAYRLIREYKSIDNLPEEYDRTPLNVEVCRQLFSSVPSAEICETSLYLERIPGNKEKLQTLLTPYQLQRFVSQLL